MPRKTAEQMFLTQGYVKVERPHSNCVGVCFSKTIEHGHYDIYINDDGGVDTYFGLTHYGVHHSGTFPILEVALKHCIKRYRQELKDVNRTTTTNV